MNMLSILCIAFGLAVDAGVVCIGSAAAGFAGNRRAVFRLVFHFGLFQACMLILGWAGGTVLEHQLHNLNHWIAAGLLGIVGARMIWAAWHPVPQTQRNDPTRGTTLLMLSIATSLDALVVGVSLALTGIKIWYPSIVVGTITAIVCFIAIRLGHHLRAVLAHWAEFAGGVVLLLTAAWFLLVG